MKGTVAPRGHLAIGREGGQDIRRFQGDLDGVEARLSKDIDVPEGAFHERGCMRSAMLGQKIPFERSRIDADADGNARLPGRLRNPADFVPRQVARIDPNRVDPLMDGREGKPVLEMDIGDQRKPAGLPDRPKRLGGLRIRHGDPDDFATGACQAADLANRFPDVARVGIRHGLDDDGRSAPHLNAADQNRLGMFSSHRWIQSKTALSGHPGFFVT